MTLVEIFDQLTYGELSQLQAGGAVEEEVTPENYKKVLAHINLGLNELYKRFRLSLKEVRIRILPGVYEYILHDRFAEQNSLSSELNRYIVDSAYDPFQNIVLQIEEVLNPKGQALCLNDNIPCPSWSPPGWDECCVTETPRRLDCLYTPRYDTIKIPLTFNEESMTVTYRAGHPPLIYDLCRTDPEKIEVNLPPGLLEPLLLFVGHRAYRALNSDGNLESTAYLKEFETACLRAHDLGLEIVRTPTNSRLDYRGWV